MMTRKVAAVSLLATAAILAPLAALRPAARADQPLPPRPQKVVPQTAVPKSSKRANKEFVKAVHQYNVSLARTYYALANVTGDYDRAITRGWPGVITPLLAPGYTLNGRKAEAVQVVSLLRPQSPGAEWLCASLTVVGYSGFPALPRRFMIVSRERHVSRHYRPIGPVLASRQDTWVRTPQGWRLAASEVGPPSGEFPGK